MDRVVERILRQQREPEGRPLLERGDEGQRVRRGKAHGADVMEPALAVVLPADDPVAVDGKFRAQFRLDDAPERVEEVGGGERVAVAPLQAGAHVEGVDPAVGRNVPALGRAGQDTMAVGRVVDQALEDGTEDVALRDADGGVRVEVARFGAVAEVENLLAVADFDGGFAPVAAGEDDQGKQGKNRGGRAHEKRCPQITQISAD